MASFIERLQQWQLKALREAKQRTSWFYPDLSYEQQQADLIEFMLCDPTSVTCRALADFVERIYVAGALNSLAAVVLRCTSPGVPDLYQGTDLWDFSLVDPDNRRPVDLERRAAALKSLDDGQTSPYKLLAEWKSGVVKQALLTRCLRVRQAYPRLFLKGHYTPLRVDGPLASHLIAFSRSVEDLAVIVVVSRLAYRAAQRTGQTLALPLIPADAWADTRITLLAMHRHKSWRNVLTAEDVAPAARMQVKALLSDLPVAVLISA